MLDDLKIYYTQPGTLGLWRPLQVEIGFVEDYLNIDCVYIDGIWIPLTDITLH
tara:strand:- start:396 stop:554 length:159 start_codon:yes stop_codon:yes gene_type:complete